VNVRNLKLTRRAGAVATLGAVVVGLGGWAFAEGGLPVVSSDASTPSSTTVSTSTAAASSPGASTDNAAVGVNSTDGRTVYAIRLKIVQTGADTVDASNAAVAAASCNDCQTVAISLEGVLVYGTPSTYDPTNIALALNSDCTNCKTLASAYQDIVQNDTRVRISGPGRQEIADIRRDLDSLRTSGLDIVAVQQRVNDDAGRFLDVLRTQVVPVGRPSSSTTTAAPAAAAAPSSTTVTTASVTTTTSAPASSEAASSTTTTSPTATSPATTIPTPAP